MIKIVTYQLEPALLPSIPICSKKMVSRYRRFTATKVENIFISSKFFINKKFVKGRQNRKIRM